MDRPGGRRLPGASFLPWADAGRAWTPGAEFFSGAHWNEITNSDRCIGLYHLRRKSERRDGVGSNHCRELRSRYRARGIHIYPVPTSASFTQTGLLPFEERKSMAVNFSVYDDISTNLAGVVRDGDNCIGCLWNAVGDSILSDRPACLGTGHCLWRCRHIHSATWHRSVLYT